MSTEAQIKANQLNAQHSTGPTSEAGKAISCQNRLRHGFAGRFSLLPCEDPNEYERMRLLHQADLNPSTPVEELLVERMAQYQWLIQRALMLQHLAFTEPTSNQELQRELALYLRYQTANERAFSKCLNDLLKLRAEKRKEQIGFESQKLKQAAQARQQSSETRKQELHKYAIWLAEAKAEHQELLNAQLETPEMRNPDRLNRVRALQTAA